MDIDHKIIGFGRKQYFIRLQNVPAGALVQWKGGTPVQEEGVEDPHARVFSQVNPTSYRIVTDNTATPWIEPTPDDWTTASDSRFRRGI